MVKQYSFRAVNEMTMNSISPVRNLLHV